MMNRQAAVMGIMFDAQPSEPRTIFDAPPELFLVQPFHANTGVPAAATPAAA
jgi:hypothetical protein